MTHIFPQRKIKPEKANFHGIALTGFIKAFKKKHQVPNLYTSPILSNNCLVYSAVLPILLLKKWAFFGVYME